MTVIGKCLPDGSVEMRAFRLAKAMSMIVIVRVTKQWVLTDSVRRSQTECLPTGPFEGQEVPMCALSGQNLSAKWIAEV